jgi:hypothetical protein
MGINTQKILLIRNSHPDYAALSQGVSEYYATARGLRDSGGNYYYLDFSIPSWGLEERKFMADAAYAAPLNTNPIYSAVNRINIDDYLVAGKATKITPTVTVGVTRMLEAIARVIDTHEIEAVFVTPGIPVAVGGISAADCQWQPTETYLSNASVVWNLAPASRKNSITLGVESSLNPNVYTPGELSNPLRYPISKKHSGRVSAVSGGRRRTMWGRIGWADTEQNFSVLGDENTVGSVRYIVENAKAMERQDNREKPHLIGGCSYFSQGAGLGALWRNYLTANLLAWDAGIQANLFYLPTGSISCRGTLVPGSEGTVYRNIVNTTCLPGATRIPCTVPPGESRIDFMAAITATGVLPAGKYVSEGEYADVIGGIPVPSGTIIDPPLTETLPAGTELRGVKYAYPLPLPFKEWFCMHYSNGSQTESDYAPGGLVNQFNRFAPGGWTLKWQSSAYIMAMMCLKTGGSLAYSNYDEPFNINLPEPVRLLAGLLAGLSGCEALIRQAGITGLGANTSAWGDP